MLYSCSHGLSREEREDGISFTDALDTTLPHLRMQRKSLDSFRTKNDSRARALTAYALHVESYTERNLSYQSDILNAFSAIISDFTSQYGFSFCWGLPTALFEFALCWTPPASFPSAESWTEALEDGQHLNFSGTFVNAGIRRKGFPSWSWTGHHYEAAILYSLDIRSVFLSYRSIVPQIVWPWGPKYACPEQSIDIGITGILCIEVELATMTKPMQGRSFLVTEDSTDLQFDDFSTWHENSSKTVIRICEVITTTNLWNLDYLGDIDSENESSNEDSLAEESSNEDKPELDLSVLMAVHCNHNGVYERDGLFIVKSNEWEAQKVHRQRIHLGYIWPLFSSDSHFGCSLCSTW